MSLGGVFQTADRFGTAGRLRQAPCIRMGKDKRLHPTLADAPADQRRSAIYRDAG